MLGTLGQLLSADLNNLLVYVLLCQSIQRRGVNLAPNVNVDRSSEPGGGSHHGDPCADPGLPLDMCDGRHERLDREAELDTGLHG